MNTSELNLTDEEGLVSQMKELEAIVKEQDLNSNVTDDDMPSLMSGKTSDDSIDLEGRQQCRDMEGRQQHDEIGDEIDGR
jgi:hypothetical protein